MKIYYVGCLYKNNSNDNSKYVAQYTKDYYYIGNLSRTYVRLDRDEYEYFKSALSRYNGIMAGITDEKAIEIFNKADKGLSRLSRYDERIVFEIIVDQDGNKYGKELFTGLLFPLEINPKIEYFYNRNEKYTLLLEKTYTDDNLARFEYILSIDEVASLNTIKKFKDMEYNEKNFESYINKIKTIHNENIFKKQIIEKDQEPLLEQNILTKLMEEIEFLLQLVKMNDVYTYNNLSLEYRKLKSSDTLIATEPSKKELENFLANVKLALLVSENKSGNLSEYLTEVYIKYSNRMNSNELSNQDLNINDIDILTEMFLVNKDKYSIVEQREILIKFSMLYLIITKANINNINIEDLKESYFSKNLKTIALCMFDLYECGAITSPINITSNDNITVENIVEIIKQLEFNNINIENSKKFLK